MRTRDTSQTTMLEAITKMARACDAQEALVIWNETNTQFMWKAYRNSCLSEDDERDLKFMAYNNVVQTLQNDKTYQNASLEGREFAKDFVLLEQYRMGHGEFTETQQYRDCSNVLYFSIAKPIIGLRDQKLPKKFPRMMRWERVREYCVGYAQLWNEVSIVDKHTAGSDPPDATCIPRSNDFKTYIENLAHSKTIQFVSISLLRA